MHFLLFVCLPIEGAKTSLQARRRACKYLEEEHFVSGGRFCGICDYFSVGGSRYSGALTLLRLKDKHPMKFQRFRNLYRMTTTAESAVQLFRRSFPDFIGSIPVGRNCSRFYGYPDDAQKMDGVLYNQLRKGFSEEVTYQVPFEQPNVIFTELSEPDWKRKSAVVGSNWVVTIEYHD